MMLGCGSDHISWSALQLWQTTDALRTILYSDIRSVFLLSVYYMWGGGVLPNGLCVR